MAKLIEADTGTGPELHSLARQLTPDRRYSIVHVGAVQFAYLTYTSHVRALGQAWKAGLIPTSGATGVAGTDLPDVAPQLKGVDTDLGTLRASDVAPRQRRFS